MSRNLLHVMAMALLVLAAGCADEPEADATATAETAAQVSTDIGGEEVPRLPDGSQPTQVVLTSYAIEMPTTLPEGTTLLTVRNESDMEHNFEIEGQGIEKEFDEPLQPGEVKTMEVTLVPGEYRVYCPVGDHATQGMELTLTVTASEGSTPDDRTGVGIDTTATSHESTAD